MSPTTALITGITGQDGSYLAEFLLAKFSKYSGRQQSARCNTTDASRPDLIPSIEKEEAMLRVCSGRVGAGALHQILVAAFHHHTIIPASA